MSGGIDYNRGTISRNTPSGIRVIEYQDEPGNYYSLAGNPIDEETARAANFDVEASRKKNRREQLYAEAKAKADSQVERDFDSIERSVEEESSAPEESPAFGSGSGTGPIEPLPARMEKAGHGRWNVLDGEGKVVAEEVSKNAATRLVADLQRR